ncbi:MAG TPA: hypothetical protein VF546_01020 [Pyrinomonadaceae bacterium]
MKLIEVLPSAPYAFRAHDLDHVWCLVIHRGGFSIDTAIEWLTNSKQVTRAHGVKRLPSIAVLVDFGQLAPAERHRLVSALPDLGVVLSDWARGASNKEQALEALRAQVASNYGADDFDQIIWGKTPIAGTAPPPGNVMEQVVGGTR